MAPWKESLPRMGRVDTLTEGPDGDIWVTNLGDGELTVARWDGRAWRAYGPITVESYPALDDSDVVSRVVPRFLADGRVWFSPLAMLDGEELRAVTLLDGIGIERPRIEQLADGPDDSVWAIISDHDQSGAEGTVDSGLYLIRPDELAVIDPR
jgi:hypothetical protein